LQKPENVLLTARNPNSQIKLADFGLAAQVLPGEMLKEGVGTPNYIAPEVLQCLEDEDDAEGYDFSCDTWSAGCILHILLCGKTPFGHIEDTDEMYDAILAGRVALDAPEWASVSEEAKELVRGLLTVDTSQRMSGSKVLKSPWMAHSQLDHKTLPGTHLELKNFNAKRRWKSSILAIIATNRVKTIADMRGAAERKRHKQEQ
jgi:serine/threonine protein kinase